MTRWRMFYTSTVILMTVGALRLAQVAFYPILGRGFYLRGRRFMARLMRWAGMDPCAPA